MDLLTIAFGECIILITVGVPKNRRGEIWRFLLKQDSLRHKNEKKPSMTLSYRELKEMASVHQHAILIDCSKLTLPLFVNCSLILISAIKVSNRSVVQYYTHTACFEEYFKGCYIKEEFKTSAKSPKKYLGYERWIALSTG